MDAPRESVLTDLIRQVGDMRFSRLPSVTTNGQGIAAAAGEDPNRFCLFGCADDGSAITFVPILLGTPAVLTRTTVMPAPAVVHASVYPVLIFERWWVVAAPATTVHLWHVQKER